MLKGNILKNGLPAKMRIKLNYNNYIINFIFFNTSLIYNGK
jgi:hypothetical protein